MSQALRRSKRWGSFTLALALGLPAASQERLPVANRTAIVAGGSVSGQVVFGDTRQPGRFATVVLLSAEHLPQRLGRPDRQSGSRSYTTTSNLLGEYTVAGVEPGDYYVVGSALGYVSPYALDGNQDATRLRAALEQAAAKVSVQANGSSRADLELTRGATLAGVVRYDDGSPAAGLPITVLTREDATSAWQHAPVSTFGRAEAGFTDDEGHWRRSGLAAGIYTVGAALPVLRSTATGDASANSSRFSVDSSGSMSTYLGGGSDSTQAHPVTVRAGEQVSGLEITIPTQGLHRVEGRVVASDTGQSLGGLNLTLQLGSAGDTSRRIVTTTDDGGFAFSNVPAGLYTLRLEGGAGANRTMYRQSEQTIEVRGSVRDLVVQATSR